jgi:hypothetical protein
MDERRGVDLSDRAVGSGLRDEFTDGRASSDGLGRVIAERVPGRAGAARGA